MSFDAVHAELRRLMLDSGVDQMIARDEPGDLILYTGRSEPKTGKPVWFGAVTTKKGYVAYHLMPLYANPSLGDGLSEALAKRRQGKSCFNFKSIDPDLFAELAELTRQANIHNE